MGGFCLGGMALPAAALGIRLADQDPFATARGNAFAATADNPAAVYYNPAGLTQLEGHHVRWGAYAIALDAQFTSPTGGRLDTKSRVDFAPQLFYSYGMKSQPLAFGLGLYAPYGLALEWPNNSEFGRLYGQMTHLSFNPVVAWQPHPTLSVGGGLTINYCETILRQEAVRNLGVGNGVNHFEGDDTDAGYNLGVRWQPMKQHALGVNYRSPTTMSLRGTGTITGTGVIDGTGAASARLPFPRHFVMGYSFRPTRDWNFEFNADWTEWSRLTTVNFHQFSGTTAVPFNWRSSWFYEFGVTRKLPAGWRASAGYIFSENSVPDADFSPLVPDSDRHIFSLGLGRTRTRVSWDVAYQLAWGPSRGVSGNALRVPATFAGPNPAASPNGQYQFLSHALTAAVTLGF